MSAAFAENGPFPRSRSSPNIPDLVNFDFKRPAARPDDELPRSASFNCLPALEDQFVAGKTTDQATSTEVSADIFTDAETLEKQDPKTPNKLTKVEKQKVERVGRRKSLVARPKSWIQRVKSSPERQSSPESINRTPIDAPPMPAISKVTRDSRTKSVSGSFATFARKSWISSSRSPSPSRNKAKQRDTENSTPSADDLKRAPVAGSTWAVASVREEVDEIQAEIDAKPLQRAPTTLQKIRQRPQSVLMNLTNFQSANSSTSSLPSSSVDNRSTPRTSTDKVPPLPKNTSNDKVNIGIEIPRRRDELWSAFRSLENEFAKFQSKSWSLKTNVVRTSLLPFLRNNASHPSNKNLRAEDLDRRVAILNKWWTGLLEVLDGRQNQTVSGVDRPILLDACYAIMTRPEWRQSPSVFAPLAERPLNTSTERRSLPRNTSSSTSLSSSASQFMVESVYHNTRNLFIQNLLAQMSFVVDKMSLRHAPASLVTFCGKAAAYAFFFVPGVADMLVRIWTLHADILRRVSDELGMPKRPNKVDMDEVVAGFPSHIHNLGWTSVKQMANQLRQTPHLPVMATKISWFGPWVARWCGRDSDLFFVFTKHYHILCEEFLPSELSLVEKARAPGTSFSSYSHISADSSRFHARSGTDSGCT
jgi:hypothetical protein